MPTTPMQTTMIPTTRMPTTPMQTTMMPTTRMPTTPMQTTMMPTTRMPTTPIQTTMMPTTMMPTTLTFANTKAPTTFMNVPITLDVYNENIKKLSPNGYVKISQTPQQPNSNSLLNADLPSNKINDPSCIFVITNGDYGNDVYLFIYLYMGNAKSNDKIKIKYEIKNFQNSEVYTNYQYYNIDVEEPKTPGSITFTNYGNFNFIPNYDPNFEKYVFCIRYSLDYNGVSLSYEDRMAMFDDSGIYKRQEIVNNENFIKGTFSINSINNGDPQKVDVTYDVLENYKPSAIITQAAPVINYIKNYYVADFYSPFGSDKIENLRTYITIEDKTYYNGDIITLDFYIFAKTNANSVGSVAIKLNIDNNYMVLHDSTSKLFNIAYGEDGKIIFGPTSIMSGDSGNRNGVGMVNLGSILFKVKNDSNTDTIKKITGQTIAIGGVYGTSFCENKFFNAKCDNSNKFYGGDSGYLPPTDECFFIYYNKIPEKS
jgi:hypothetical protein